MLTEAYPIARRSERIFTSIPVTLLVDVDGRKVAWDAYTVDLSQLGVRVRAHVALTPGQTVEVVPSEGPKYAVRSRVVWVGEADSGRDAQAGLEFLSPFPAAA